MRVKSSGLANARPPGRAKFANAPPPGLRAGKCPAVARRGGGWARLELTDALTTAFGNIVSHRSQKCWAVWYFSNEVKTGLAASSGLILLDLYNNYAYDNFTIKTVSYGFSFNTNKLIISLSQSSHSLMLNIFCSPTRVLHNIWLRRPWFVKLDFEWHCIQ